MSSLLTEDQFAEALRSIKRSAFRLELQPAYNEPGEGETVERFLRGQPQDPTEVPSLRDWFDQVRKITQQGRRVTRVRVQQDPPTGYQQWERWIGRWNIAAGETIRYLTIEQAKTIGLLPSAGDVDWWLIDDTALILMRFDDRHRRIANELTTDQPLIEQARAWRDLANRHGVPDQPENATTA